MSDRRKTHSRPSGSRPAGTSLPSHIEALLREEAGDDAAALARVWETAGIPLEGEPSDAEFAAMGDEVWASIEPRIRESSDRPARPALRQRTRRWIGAAFAVAVAGLFAVFVLSAERTIHAPAGERITHTLPDGSTVELNSGASLTYAPRTFGWLRRGTSLHGEAFFSIVPRETEFVTRTFNAEVRVLGTSFNVRAWPDEQDAGTIVTLHTGKVRLSNRAPEARSVILEPGQMSRVENVNVGPTHPEATDLAQAAAWRTGRFVFVDTPLRTILADLERRFDVSIRADAAEILDDRLTLAYEEPGGARVILEDITAAYSRYSFRQISGGYELYVPER